MLTLFKTEAQVSQSASSTLLYFTSNGLRVRRGLVDELLRGLLMVKHLLHPHIFQRVRNLAE